MYFQNVIIIFKENLLFLFRNLNFIFSNVFNYIQFENVFQHFIVYIFEINENFFHRISLNIRVFLIIFNEFLIHRDSFAKTIVTHNRISR